MYGQIDSDSDDIDPYNQLAGFAAKAKVFFFVWLALPSVCILCKPCGTRGYKIVTCFRTVTRSTDLDHM